MWSFGRSSFVVPESIETAFDLVVEFMSVIRPDVA